MNNKSMTKQQIEDPLKLKVTDFGPIVEAEIDLRPLTVFIGPSNTGKSYLAILIYALHQVFNSRINFSRRRYFSIGFSAIQKMSKAEIRVLLEAANPIVSVLESEGSRRLTLPRPLAELARLGIHEIAGGLSNEIARCFGIGKSYELIRHGRTNVMQIVIQEKSYDADQLLQQTISRRQQPECTSTVSAGKEILWNFKDRDSLFKERLISYIQYADNKKSSKDDLQFMAIEVVSTLFSLLLPSLLGPLHSPAYYLPADRTGVMHAHNVVVSALIASAPTGGLRPVDTMPTLSGVLADFLQELIKIDQKKRGMTRNDIAGKIEDLILEGSVSINRPPHINYPRFAYRPHGWKKEKDALALANASSMVSELAPVVLYLRHMIKPGNVLIVEEPESHLHPAMQVKFTRQLAALVEAGVRVIVTTHSEWLLEELANIVQRSKIPKTKRNGEIALREDQVGAWLFKPQKSPKGSVVNQVSFDESGLYSSGYNEVAETLHNDWASISSHIQNHS
ncbi:MAG: AAA family ATPase [Aestuariivita sp.]|nr:AAA family ATPase [Aestuariivita sp.]MCY4203860.1 AAA family ATPase [Aestuariivita sp.]